MMIKVLDSKTISQSAAGEVVERPASVAKELIENALDAGSTQISVEVKGGGISLLRITDNGSGIDGSEVETAFERHATSKIGSLVDLQRLSTLGFRGEALPSIAAVAQVQMVTSARGESGGTYLSLEDGQVLQHDPQARSQGTTITVQNLFRKIPARLKFLKSESAEAGRIADIVSQYALAYPEVRFTLTNEGKTTLRTPGSGKLIDAVMAVYGLDTARQMLEVKGLEESPAAGKAPIIVSGLVGSPKIARSNRDYLSFFVNRRWVNNRMLAFAVEEAYHGLLMQGKHPIAVLNITIPPQLIDVNVHPAKTEIKFQEERLVFAAVQRSVRSVLVQSAPVPEVEESRTHFNTPSTPFSPVQPTMGLKTGTAASARSRTEEQPPAPTPLISLPLLRVLGQLARNYIVAEGPDGLYLIDQHAAHERIMLEKVRRQHETRKFEVQGLLQPATFDVDPRQAAVLKSHLGELSDFGFTIEPFGERTYLVRAVPAVLRERDWAAMLRESLDTLAANWAENLLNTLACHSAVRAGQVLSDTEMRELIQQLEQTALPNSCPHGRPTMVRITNQQLEKEFGRS
jgi:DNA mismatch repair protein MutL